MHTFKVIDRATGAFAHVEARTEIEAAIKCGKTAADIDAGRIKVEYVGDGARWQNFGGAKI